MTLSSVAQLIARHPMHWKVEGSIPSLGTYSGCRFKPQSGVHAGGNQSVFLSYVDVSQIDKNVFLKSMMNEHINENIMKIKCFLQTSVFFSVQIFVFFGNIRLLGRNPRSFSFVSEQINVTKRR